MAACADVEHGPRADRTVASQRHSNRQRGSHAFHSDSLRLQKPFTLKTCSERQIFPWQSPGLGRVDWGAWIRRSKETQRRVSGENRCRSRPKLIDDFIAASKNSPWRKAGEPKQSTQFSRRALTSSPLPQAACSTKKRANPIAQRAAAALDL